jgi:hypothetical protein
MLGRVLIATILVVVGLPGLAVADELLTWGEVNSESNDFTLTNVGTYETFTATSDISVNFNSVLTTGLPSTVSATLTLNASTATAATGSSTLDEGGWSGSFTIIDTVAGADYGTNLLSGTFGPIGDLSGRGHSMTFSDSTPPGSEVVFTSDYLNFNNYSGDLAFSWSMSNITPALQIVADGFLNSVTGAGSGNFSADPLPPVIAPEPSTLLPIGVALAGLGLVLRKRKLEPVL